MTDNGGCYRSGAFDQALATSGVEHLGAGHSHRPGQRQGREPRPRPGRPVVLRQGPHQPTASTTSQGNTPSLRLTPAIGRRCTLPRLLLATVHAPSSIHWMVELWYVISVQ